jgi:hypothetical protein
MSELEIRAAIQKLCADLDLRARTIARGAVIPLAIGAGVALVACDTKDETTTGSGGQIQPLYAAPGGAGGAGGGGAAAPLYAAPGGGGVGGLDGGGGVGTLYAAPGGGGTGGG